MSFRSSLFFARQHAGRGAKALHGMRRRLFEQLESRCVLSCTAVVDSLKSTLLVTGDGGINKVSVQDSSIAGITVTCDGSVFKADSARHITVNTLGGSDTFEVKLGNKEIDPTNSNLPVLSTPLDLNLNGGGGADSYLIGLLNVAISNDFDITATGGDGEDTFEAKLENVQFSGQSKPDTDAHVTLNGGGGANSFLIGLLNVAAPLDPAALHIDVTGAAGNDDVTTRVQDSSIDLHLDVSLGAGKDTFTATILPDAGANPFRTGEPCMDFAIHGGPGADTLQVNVGQENAPEQGKQQPQLASELMLSLDGGSEADQIGVEIHNVALGAEAQIGVDSGIGADRILIGLLNVTAPSDPSVQSVAAAGSGESEAEEVALDFDLLTGDGDDEVTTSVEGLGLDLHFDASLGAGRDLFNAKLAMGASDHCMIFGVSGGDGADTFQVDVFDAKTPGSGDKLPDPDAMLQLKFAGEGGADAFLVGMLDVTIHGDVLISADGGDGNDSFKTTFADLNGDGVWKTAFDGGKGNDTLVSSYSNFSPEYFLKADLGAGNDSALVSIIDPEVASITDDDNAPSAIGIDVAGGDGQDSLSLSFLGELRGPTKVILDGGEGNDAIDAVFNVASTNDYSLLAHVIGGKGNDNLAFHVKVFDSESQKDLDLLLDASQGHDKYVVTDNVTVQKV